MAASSDSNIATYVRLASCKAEISACYHVMKQLRLNQPCMTDVEVFASSVQRLQQQEGYQLASLVLRDTCAVVAVAGYRVGESLANGKELYVYDLVTDSAHRSQGRGQALLQWLREQAAAQQCNKLWLVSGAQRVDAHRFYKANGMLNFGLVFMLDL